MRKFLRNIEFVVISDWPWWKKDGNDTSFDGALTKQFDGIARLVATLSLRQTASSSWAIADRRGLGLAQGVHSLHERGDGIIAGHGATQHVVGGAREVSGGQPLNGWQRNAGT